MLNNNSNEMKTVVETFLIEEVTELLHDNEKLDQWHQLCAELGLEGQKQIVSADKSPIPFLWMNTGLCNILSTLCPRKVDIAKFDLMPIPVEILSLAGLSKRENYFRKIEIWYDDQQKDPACIGITSDMVPVDSNYHSYSDHPVQSQQEALDYLLSIGKKPYSDKGYTFNNEKKYLIGKWADLKHSFAELKEMAITRYIGERKNTLQDNIKIAQRELDDLESVAFKMFGSSAPDNSFPF